jgi:hypothetical protein
MSTHKQIADEFETKLAKMMKEAASGHGVNMASIWYTWLHREGTKIIDAMRLAEEHAKLIEALTPSAETKAEYIGEFSFYGPEYVDDKGEPRADKMLVPWSTVKVLMAAIRKRAER